VIVLAQYQTLTGTFAGLSNLSNIDVGAYSFQINYNYNSLDQIALVSTAVPEPGTLGLLLLFCSVMMVFRRRDRKQELRRSAF